MGRFWACSKVFGPAGAESTLGPPLWSALRHNARGSPPAWLNPQPSTLKSLLVLSRGPEWASRIPLRPSGAGVLEALGRHFWAFFRFLDASSIILHAVVDFWRF